MRRIIALGLTAATMLMARDAAAADIDCCAQWDECFTELDADQKDYLICLGDVRGREALKGLQLSEGDEILRNYRYPFFMSPNSCTQVTLCGLFVSGCEQLRDRAAAHNEACQSYRSSL